MIPEIRKYLDALPEKRAAKLEAIHDLIMKLYPKAEQSLDYKMPTYKRGGAWMTIGNQKAHISVYTCSEEQIAPYVEKHPKISCGKGCLRFRDTQDVDMAAMRQVIKKAMTAEKPGK